MYRWPAVLAMVASLGACGGSDGEKDNGDDGPHPDPVPRVVQTTPEDGASPVSVIADLLVEVSGTLDPTSVNEETVRVFNDYDAVLEASVTWDESTRMITLDPTYPLGHGRPHRLEIDGLTDPDGRAVEPATVEFTTYDSPSEASETYDTDGRLVFRTEFRTDEFGRITEIRRFGAPGADATWFTQDDIIIQFEERSYDDDAGVGTITATIPGIDGVIGSGDDKIVSLVEESYNSQGDYTVRTRFDGGLDDSLGTGDDTVAQYDTNEYDARGAAIRNVLYTDPGEDATWFTEDDVVESIHEWTPEENLIEGVRTLYGLPGDDGVWFTEDDLIASYRESALVATHHVRTLAYDHGGPDGILGTDDDMPTGYTDALYEDNFLIVSSEAHDSGLDGQIFTEDDVPVGSRMAYEYDEEGNRKRSLTFGAGPDRRWNTADDVLMESYVYIAF